MKMNCLIAGWHRLNNIRYGLIKDSKSMVVEDRLFAPVENVVQLGLGYLIIKSKDKFCIVDCIENKVINEFSLNDSMEYIIDLQYKCIEQELLKRNTELIYVSLLLPMSDMMLYFETRDMYDIPVIGNNINNSSKVAKFKYKSDNYVFYDGIVYEPKEISLIGKGEERVFKSNKDYLLLDYSSLKIIKQGTLTEIKQALKNEKVKRLLSS